MDVCVAAVNVTTETVTPALQHKDRLQKRCQLYELEF